MSLRAGSWLCLALASLAGSAPACGSTGDGSPDDGSADVRSSDDVASDDGTPDDVAPDAPDVADASDDGDTPTTEPRAILIVLAKEPTELDSYLLLANPAVAVAYRSPSPHPADQDAFETQGRPYYFTAASSDFPNYLGEPLYVDLATIGVVAARPRCRGFYLHEVLTLAASERSWDWPAALDAFDWAWMEQVVAEAELHRKAVIWSEPSYAWQTLDESASAAGRFAAWGPTIIPMFATNFPTQIADARQHAQAVAERHGLALGESHQAWYFIDSGLDVTREGSFDLAKVEGWDHGATYFQFEGTSMDLFWDSPYMLGVRDFAAFLQALAP